MQCKKNNVYFYLKCQSPIEDLKNTNLAKKNSLLCEMQRP